MASACRRAVRYVLLACSTEAKAIAASTSQSSRRRSEWAGALRCVIVVSLPRHHVAQAAHGLDQLGAELLAQAVDIDLDGVAGDVFLPAVELFLELRARKNGARPQQHRLEHRPFARRQRHRLA